MKNAALNNKDIMSGFLAAILIQAAKDLKGKPERNRLEAEIFVKTEYCKLICYVANVDYTILIKIANKETYGMILDKETLKR